MEEPASTRCGERGYLKIQYPEKVNTLPKKTYQGKLPWYPIQTISGSCFSFSGNDPQRETWSQLHPLGAIEAI
jgi:hypothetical protein